MTALQDLLIEAYSRGYRDAQGTGYQAAAVAAELAPTCSTCGGTRLVDWEPGAHRDSEERQQPCPDCTRRRPVNRGVQIGDNNIQTNTF